jgi:hypothetical protein
MDSIHHQRRWYYALWVALLGAALGALVLWTLPVRKGTARVGVALRLESSDGMTAQMGCFAHGQLPQEWTSLELKEGRFVGMAPVALAYRRWTGAPHSGRCQVGVMLRFQKGGVTRYYPLDLRPDIASGLFAPGRRMTLEYNGLAWERMYEDIPPPSALP